MEVDIELKRHVYWRIIMNTKITLIVNDTERTVVTDPARSLLDVLREGSEEDASRTVLAGLAHGVPDQKLWTAIFLAAGDLLLKQSGIISVHANTTSNALHYAYHHAANRGTRRLMLLQAAAFLPLFRDLLSS